VFQTAERWVNPQAETFEVRTSIDVDAPSEKVWKQVVAFAEIPPPTELLFRAGIAYPIRAEISGHGVGAVRHWRPSAKVKRQKDLRSCGRREDMGVS
jgi:hypothetical protein